MKKWFIVCLELTMQSVSPLKMGRIQGNMRLLDLQHTKKAINKRS
ncbi:hypothetical protein J2Z69_001621 [Paenibacillus shirakamiensis]|uniref:Uncharacterized protein n=1 Tax=Paenibacillus shirakamiensis TaxID=1265935 RepID=A0ABS4JHQ5_9BACL|nr:hypothetical protein [Paenibacillus shirakamiensis]